MKECPLCQSRVSASTLMCDCGYNFETREVTNSLKARAWVNSSLNKQEMINREKRVHSIQLRKHGKKAQTPGSANAPGWSMRDTARLLGKSPSTISLHFQNTEDRPEKSYFTSEDELQEFIFKNWNKTPLASEFSLEGKSVNTNVVGEIDFLAKHRREPRWLVIELKVDRSADQAVGQVLRYMGWVKREKATGDELVEGLIISGSPDIRICYALECTTNIDYQVYRVKDNKILLTRWNVYSYHKQQVQQAVDTMTPKEFEGFLSELGRKMKSN